MAFDARSFDPAGNGMNGAPRIMSYRTADAVATVEASGYFTPMNTLIQTGDFILVDSTNAAPFAKLYRLINTAGVITVGLKVALA